MEGAIMTPGNTRLKSRVRNNPSRSSITSTHLLSRNHINNQAVINKNKRNGVSRSNSRNNNSRHTFPKNSRDSQTVDNAYVNINNGNHECREICPGKFTEEVYNAIGLRLGHTLYIPEDSVQAVFNELHLYPSQSQVTEMLQCARQCGRRNGTSKYLTFGEFCVFTREMQQNQTSKHHPRIERCRPTKYGNRCEVFLGGSCNPTTWRADTAIPELQKHGITFYNPQVPVWVPELVAQEHDAKEDASVLLFVVDSQTRSTVGMIEVAYLVSSGRCVVLVAQPYKPGQSIMDETITQREYRDLVEGQTTLLTLVRSRGLREHNTLPSALKCIASYLRDCNSSELTDEEQLTNKLRKLRQVFDSYGGQTGEMNGFKLLHAYQELTQRELKLTELYKYLRSSNESDANRSISFDRFCMLMSEFTSNNCDTCTTNVWASQSLQRQSSTNNNTLDNSYVNEEALRNVANKQKTHDVFLGGTHNSRVHWRRDVAIPTFEKNGISYYNPTIRENDRVDNGDPSDQFGSAEWKEYMDASKVLLFVITSDTRSLTTMILAAHYIGLGSNVVLCIQQLPEDCVICNETLSSQAIKDYNRGRVYVADMAKRGQIPVFENITKAVQCVVEKCQN